MDELLALIAALHEGAVDDDHWLAALDRLSDAFGGCAIFLGTTQRNGSAFELSGHRVDPQWSELVNGELASDEANPVFATVRTTFRSDPMGMLMRPMIMSRFLEPEVYRSSAIYTRAICPAGHEHAMAMVLSADPASAISLTLVRPEAAGDFTERDAEVARAVGPHILGALKLRHQFALARSSALMLDRFDHGVVLLAASGHVVHANSEAERQLAARDGLSVEQGQLRAAASDSARRKARSPHASGKATASPMQRRTSACRRTR